MFRRILLMFVIVGHIASHLASASHAHVGMAADERRKHDATPHFHCGEHSEHHQHHAFSHGSHQIGSQRLHSLSARTPDFLDSTGPAFGRDHDEHAVYFADLGVAFIGSLRSECSGSLSLPSFLLFHPILRDRADTAHWPTGVHAPNVERGGTKIYLTLRNLRI